MISEKRGDRISSFIERNNACFQFDFPSDIECIVQFHENAEFKSQRIVKLFSILFWNMHFQPIRGNTVAVKVSSGLRKGDKRACQLKGTNYPFNLCGHPWLLFQSGFLSP